MVKKGSAKPRARKKKKKPGLNYKRQFMKIVAGLALLICLIVTAGLLANRFLMKPAPMVASKPKRVPVTKPDPGQVHHSIPDYEAFPRESVPPPAPITRPKPVTNGIPVAIIIDDIGYDKKMAEGFMALNVPLTFSLLPMGTFNHRIIDRAIQKDVEIMLHQPMEPSNYPNVNPGPAALFTTMSPDRAHIPAHHQPGQSAWHQRGEQSHGVQTDRFVRSDAPDFHDIEKAGVVFRG